MMLPSGLYGSAIDSRGCCFCHFYQRCCLLTADDFCCDVYENDNNVDMLL